MLRTAKSAVVVPSVNSFDAPAATNTIPTVTLRPTSIPRIELSIFASSTSRAERIREGLSRGRKA